MKNPANHILKIGRIIMEFSDTYQINYCLIEQYPCNSGPGVCITMSNLTFNTQYMVTTELKFLVWTPKGWRDTGGKPIRPIYRVGQKND